MKDSSWLINITISLLKKILQKKKFSQRRFKRRKDFLFRTSCKTPFRFPTSVPPRYLVQLSSTSQVRSFSKTSFLKHRHNARHLCHSAVHDRGRGYSNSFDSAEFVHFHHTIRYTCREHHGLPATVCEHQITDPNFHYVYASMRLPLQWVCSPRHRVS